MKKTSLLLLFFCLTLSLIGCSDQPVNSTSISSSISPTNTGLPAGKPQIEAPGRLFTPEPPSTQIWPTEAGGAVKAAEKVLAEQTKNDITTIKVVSVEEVDWSDGCLGIQVAGVSCTQVITPGYKIILAIDAIQYEVHTDTSGMIVVMVPSQPLSQEPDIAWQGNEQPCQTAVISNQGVSYGSCQETLVNAPFINSIRASQFTDFVQEYQAFNADTTAGKVTFIGQGQIVATPAQKRAISEWAGLVFIEEQSGIINTNWSLAFTWQRIGGIAGFCDGLSVYRDGEVVATSCKDETLKNDGHLFLTSDQLAQLYQWLDGLKPFEVNQTDQAVADGMTVRMKFFGTGQIEAGQSDQLDLLSFASELSIQTRN